MSKASIGFKIAWKLIKFAFTLCIFTVIGILIWRVASSGESKDMRTLYPTEKIVSLYERDGKDMYMFDQKQRSITSGDDNYGYFSVTSYRIIPEIDHIEIVVRYNTATIRRVSEDYSLDAIPPRDTDMFDISLVFAKDLTPDDDTDNLGNKEGSVEFVRCFGEVVMEAEKNLYNYKKLVFDTSSAGIDISDMTESDTLLAVYTDFYLDYGDIKPDYAEDPIGAVCLYDYVSEDQRMKLSSKDIKAIKEITE
jgi:hypothetical protein